MSNVQLHMINSKKRNNVYYRALFDYFDIEKTLAFED